jgi:hypothetical protein
MFQSVWQSVRLKKKENRLWQKLAALNLGVVKQPKKETKNDLFYLKDCFVTYLKFIIFAYIVN